MYRIEENISGCTNTCRVYQSVKRTQYMLQYEAFTVMEKDTNYNMLCFDSAFGLCFICFQYSPGCLNGYNSMLNLVAKNNTIGRI